MPDWDRRPNEPARWYARFDIYRLLGPSRTIEKTYRISAEAERLTAARPGSAWYTTSRKWAWQARAETWDQAERERLRAVEEDRRFDAREHRLYMIDTLLSAVFAVINSIKMRELPPEQALRWLPTMRMLFKDLINAQRAELGLPTVITVTDPDEAARFTADELLAAQRELEQWLREQGADPPLLPEPKPPP